jgi:Family of unknown function (DUF5652)
MFAMEQILGEGFPIWLLVIILIWSVAWKGVALWKAAQIGDKRWFIALLVMNTFGILDVIYIRFIASKYSVERVESK